MARPLHHPSAKDITIDGILYALADPVRRGIVLKLLSGEKMNCGKACGDLSPSTISFHYKILRESGLILSEKKGVEVVNCLRKDEVDKRFPGLLDSILKNHRPPKR
jgi:DNA-binding transcriptional ArsR family regulator